MTVTDLCKKIELQDELAQKAFDFAKDFDFSPFEETISNLTKPELSESAYKTLSEALGEDPFGAKILACYLKAALITYDEYKRLGIDEQTYTDTMKSFTRFSADWLERKDILGFFSAYWSYRHLNTTLIRVGTLEYERVIRNGIKCVSVHIPSDADLSKESLDKSFTAAKQLLKAHFPDYADAPIYCESWLLYKGLEEFLDESSKIMQFQARFDIQKTNSVSKNALIYIFHRIDCNDCESLPESTSLQRKVKAHLLSGGTIGSGYGVLKANV